MSYAIWYEFFSYKGSHELTCQKPIGCYAGENSEITGWMDGKINTVHAYSYPFV